MLEPAEAAGRAADLVALARRAGADAAEAIVHVDRATHVGIRLGALEDVERSESGEIGLRLFVGDRSASISSADVSADAFAAMVERALAMARAAPDDPLAGLAPAEMLARGPFPSLDLDDGGEGTVEALADRARAAEDAARAVPGVTNSEGGSASASRAVVALATSEGFAGGYATSAHGVSASVLAGTGAAMQRDHASHGARHRADLEDAVTIGRRAGERAVARLDPVAPPGGTMPVLFDKRVSASLVGHVLGAISGLAVARGTSFLKDRLGQRILPAGVSILDDPHRPRGLRSRPFDGEGLPTAARALVDDGVLAGWMMTVAAARQLGLRPTGHAGRGGAGAPGVSASNVHITAGRESVATLVAGVRRGVVVTELIGQGVNAVTGDYSRGASGWLIEDGRITRPAAGFTIAATLPDMLATLVAADDLEFRHGVNAPSLLVEAMTVAGG